MDHSLRCTYAAGDLRAHGQLILEELPEDIRTGVGVFLYDEQESAAVGAVRALAEEFFEGGHWASSLLPLRDDPLWGRMMIAAEDARRALILNGLPAWNEDSSRRAR